MMLLALTFRFLLASYSAVQVCSVKSPKPRATQGECFSSPRVDHYVCPSVATYQSRITLIFSYTCKWKRLETNWFHVPGSKGSNALAQQLGAEGPLTMMRSDYSSGSLVRVEGCSTCLQFAGPSLPLRDEGIFFVKVVVDNKARDEFTSKEIRIHHYESGCPKLTDDPLTVTVNSLPLTSETLVSVSETVRVDFVLPPDNPAVKAALYVAQGDLTYVRRQIPYACDRTTKRCTGSVKMASRAIPKVFHVDEEATKIQIMLLLHYKEMTPLVFRRDFQLINPNFKKPPL